MFRNEWTRFEDDFKKASHLRSIAASTFAFHFVKGTLLQALENGHWLFLDEINLAPPEALHTIAAVLEGTEHVVLNLIDQGCVSIRKHPNFRIVGAMNPATDFGKKDLTPPIRNKFTEIWVSEPESKEDVEMLVAGYLSNLGPSIPISKIVDFYFFVKKASEGDLQDGADQSPCYSLRTLSRFMEYVRKMVDSFGIQRVLFDGISMAFCTQLDHPSATKMSKWIQEKLLTEPLYEQRWKKTPPKPSDDQILFEEFWLQMGSEEIPSDIEAIGKPFVLTPSIRQNLRNLARAVTLQ